MFAEAIVLNMDFASVVAGASTIAAAIVAHAKLIVGYMERKDSDHKNTIQTLTTQFREDLRENRAETRVIVDRVFQGQDKLFEGHLENREDIDKIKAHMESPGLSGIRRKPPSSGG